MTLTSPFQFRMFHVFFHFLESFQVLSRLLRAHTVPVDKSPHVALVAEPWDVPGRALSLRRCALWAPPACWGSAKAELSPANCWLASMCRTTFRASPCCPVWQKEKKKDKQTNHPNPAKLTGITCTHANLENSFFPSLLHLLSLYSRPDFMIRQFLPGHDVLVDYADAAYSHHIMMYGYLSTQMSVQTTFLWPLVLAFLPSPAWYTQCQVPCVSCSLQEAVLCKLPCHASPCILFYSK